MKLSPKQVAASATGAVLAALIASFFGEKGTIVGIALGSIVATTATALVMQSLERTHQAVQQAVRSSDRTAMFRRLGGSRPVGSVSEATEPSPVARPAPESSLGGGSGSVSSGDSVTAGASDRVNPGGTDGDRRLVASARSPATAPDRRPPSAGGSSGPADGNPPAAGQRDGERRWISWRVLAASVGLVFVVALLTVTAIELLVGRPLASVVGSSQSNRGTTLSNLGSSPTTTTPPTTTSTTASGATTTSSTLAQASTTTTGVATSSTTTSTSTTTTTTTTTQPPGSPSPGGAAAGG